MTTPRTTPLLDFLPDGRVIYVEQLTARVRVLTVGTGVQVAPVLTVAGVNAGGERGLLGVGWTRATRPRRISISTTTSSRRRASASRATRSPAISPARVATWSPRRRRDTDVVDAIPDAAPNHNGGTLRFDTGRLALREPRARSSGPRPAAASRRGSCRRSGISTARSKPAPRSSRRAGIAPPRASRTACPRITRVTSSRATTTRGISTGSTSRAARGRSRRRSRGSRAPIIGARASPRSPTRAWGRTARSGTAGRP